MSELMRAIGLMSGTSLDGIDIGLIETDGESHVRTFAGTSVAYPDAFRERLRQALIDAKKLERRMQRIGILEDVERELTERHAEAVLRFMGDRMLQPSAIDVIGFHGQTVLHRPIPQPADEFVDDRLGMPEVRELARPPRMMTVQLGDGAELARRTGVDVVYDLRAADCDAGGQGAPLVPVYHRALAGRMPERPLAFVNIGGVANVTYIGHDGGLIAFDTGPGNALIDDWMLRHTGTARDQDGALAASGRVDDVVLHHLLGHAYFAEVPPKSLDRNDFGVEAVSALSPADGAATLTAFTARSIARAREHMPEEPRLWIVCGGGRRNKTLMGMLAGAVENAVTPAEALGLDGDNLEAEAWAYLAVRSLKGLPITFPGTTGVEKPLSGGVLAKAP